MNSKVGQERTQAENSHGNAIANQPVAVTGETDAMLVQQARASSQLLTPETVTAVQRSCGNQAANRLIEARTGGSKPETAVSARAAEGRAGIRRSPQSRQLNGLPDDLKAGVEDLSGLSMDDVNVHYNSPAPAELNALAYAQGNEVHVGPGQEKQLPHEAWHVVQQKQGRVPAGPQLKLPNIQDDEQLETEADVMGEKALRQGRDSEVGSVVPAVSSASPLGTQPIQLSFDKHNRGRLKRAGEVSGGKKMKLDHSVSQDTLKALADCLEQVRTFCIPEKTLFQLTRAAIQEFDELIATMTGEKGDYGDHKNSLESLLLNLRANLTPGHQKQFANPDETFDPQLAMEGNVTATTALSDELLELDNAARQLIRLCPMFPNQNSGLTIKGYNQRVDEEISTALKTITECITAAEARKEPVFDPNLWYQHGDGYVKRPSAEWLESKPEELGDSEIDENSLGEATFTWVKTLSSLEIKKKKATLEEGVIDGKDEYKANVPVNIKVGIPEECWQHIYERHYMPTFKNVVEAINTFWKEDPATTIDQDLLEPEINLLIDRKIDLRAHFREGEEYTEIGINEPVKRLFFQGTIQITKKPQSMDLMVELKSIAPQDSELGYGITPDILEGE